MLQAAESAQGEVAGKVSSGPVGASARAATSAAASVASAAGNASSSLGAEERLQGNLSQLDIQLAQVYLSVFTSNASSFSRILYFPVSHTFISQFLAFHV